MFLYHIFKNVNPKLGLCSPQCLYDNDINLFKRTSFKIYEERAKKFLKKQKVDNDDIIFYLNNSPDRIPYFNSSTIFLSMLSLDEAHDDFKKKFVNFDEGKIKISYLKKQTNKVILVGPGKKEKFINWKDLENEKFLDKVKILFNKKPPDKLIFKYVPHIALHIYNIPKKEIII
jgi:Fe-S oxidoreductase